MLSSSSGSGPIGVVQITTTVELGMEYSHLAMNRFCLGMRDGRSRVRRRDSQFSVKRLNCTIKVMVSGNIAHSNSSFLVFISGNMTVQCYIH